MSLIVSFFMGFCVDSSNGNVRSDIILRSNPIRYYVVDLEFYVL